MFVCLSVCIYVPYGRPNGWADREWPWQKHSLGGHECVQWRSQGGAQGAQAPLQSPGHKFVMNILGTFKFYMVSPLPAFWHPQTKAHIYQWKANVLRRKRAARRSKFDFRWGSAPDPAGGACSAPPDPLAVFKGAYF